MFRLHAFSVGAAVLATLTTIRPCQAALTLGANAQVTRATYPDAEWLKETAIGLPGRAQVVQPGLRIGYLAPGDNVSLNLDLGFSRDGLGRGYSDEQALVVTTGGQYAFNSSSRTAPYVTASIGLNTLKVSISFTDGFEVFNSTRATFGGGVGLRHMVSERHGMLRAEVRYDNLPKKSERYGVEFLAAHLVSLRVGFDLIMGRR